MTKMDIKAPKTVIIGASGFLGSSFLMVYRHIHPDCLGTSRKPKGAGIFSLDLLNLNIAPLHLTKKQHKEALILAGVTKISKCEIDKELTRKINVEGTLELIRQLANEGIKPIFTSSDYVFDGYRGNYLDDSPPNPTTEYGLQKAEVEAKIAEVSGGNYLVVRLSKVFSLIKGDGSLLDEMASILSSAGTVRAAYDQVFCPILISDLIKAVTGLQTQGATGVVNVCSPEAWSRYDLALEMAKHLGIDSNRVRRISLDELDFGPKRPKNTSMQIKRLRQQINSTFTSISKCAELVAENWKGQNREK